MTKLQEISHHINIKIHKSNKIHTSKRQLLNTLKQNTLHLYSYRLAPRICQATQRALQRQDWSTLVTDPIAVPMGQTKNDSKLNY